MSDDPAVSLMMSYFPEQRHIEHTLKVLEEAERILAATSHPALPSEQSEEPGAKARAEIVRLSCVFHDIGIPNAIRIHGSAAGPYQEREGAVVAEKLLRRLDVQPDVRDRVTYIVGHHHTRSAIDGFDFKVVWDADMIVNLSEGNVAVEGSLEDFVRDNFETEAGAARALERPRTTGARRGPGGGGPGGGGPSGGGAP